MLSITRRDDKDFTFYLYDTTGSATNLTGCTLFVTVKLFQDDLDASAKIATTLTIATPATLGIAVWSLVPADTQYLLGFYSFDIQLKSAAGKIYTIMSDILQVLPDYTIRIA